MVASKKRGVRKAPAVRKAGRAHGKSAAHAKSVAHGKATTRGRTSPALATPRLMRKATMSPEEWQLRVDLAACYQLIDLYGMSDLSRNHISVRVPGPEDHFLLNPLGVLYDQITASSLIKVDTEGNIIEGEARQLNPAGFIIHSAIHRAQRELVCVLHTHTRATLAVGALKAGLLPISQTAISVMAMLRYHEYEGPSLDPAERERLAAHLDSPAVRLILLRNHGALSVGRTIAEAFVWMHRLETACDYQNTTLAASAAGYPLSLPSDDLTKLSIERTGQVMLSGKIMATGTLEWPSLLRKLERERGSSYRT